MWIVLVWISYEDIDEVLGPFESEEAAEENEYVRSRRSLGYSTSTHEVRRPPCQADSSADRA